MAENNQLKWRGVRPTPITSITSGQKSISTSDTKVVDASTTRDYIMVKNIGSVAVYVRPATSITTANGDLLYQGDAAIYEGYLGEVHAIVSSGSGTLYYEEG